MNNQQQQQQQQGNPNQNQNQGVRTYVTNPGVAAGVAMNMNQNQQQQMNNQMMNTGGGGRQVRNSGTGNTTIIRPAPGTTTDVIIRRPGPDGRPPPLPVMPNTTQRLTSSPGTTGIVRAPQQFRSRGTQGNPGNEMMGQGSGYGSLNSSTLLCSNPACYNTGSHCPMPGCHQMGGPNCPYNKYGYPCPASGSTAFMGPFPPQYYGIGSIPAIPNQYAGTNYPANYYQQQQGPGCSRGLNPNSAPNTNTVIFVGGDDGTLDLYGRKARGIGGSGTLVPLTRGLNDPNYMKNVLQGIQQALGDPRTGLNNPRSQGPPGFEVLYDTENFFIESSDGTFGEAFLDMRSRFDILDTNGERLFYAAENPSDLVEKSSCCASNAFKLSVIGCDGNEYMTVTGDSGAVGMRTIVPDSSDGSKASKFLGYVVPDSNCCSINTDYIIKDRHGNTCFKVLHEDSNPNPTEFEVYGNDMLKIGRMSKVWAGLPQPDQALAHTYGISFPRDMDVREKALMLAALFTVYFKYFADRSRDRRVCRNAWICTILIMLFFLAFIVGLVFLAVHILRS